MMRISTAIILAGGLGTRLRDAVPDLPKCMAPVRGKPFIGYVIDYLQHEGIEYFIFSLGYRSEDFIQFIESTLPAGHYQLVIESEPLGTGGAIQFACRHTGDKQVLVLNGDSIFKVDVDALASFHQLHEGECTLALKPMKNFERYGVVELGAGERVVMFREKQSYAEGLINGGVYVLDVPAFLEKNLPDKFSFESDYLQHFYPSTGIFGMKQDRYFIDIGIPEDYQRAQQEL